MLIRSIIKLVVRRPRSDADKTSQEIMTSTEYIRANSIPSVHNDENLGHDLVEFFGLFFLCAIMFVRSSSLPAQLNFDRERSDAVI